MDPAVAADMGPRPARSPPEQDAPQIVPWTPVDLASIDTNFGIVLPAEKRGQSGVMSNTNAPNAWHLDQRWPMGGDPLNEPVMAAIYGYKFNVDLWQLNDQG